MGLDMYLHRKTGVMKELQHDDIYRPEGTYTFRGYDWGSDEPPPDWHDGVTEVAYWRKANQIHAWFVEHCQGGVDECQMTPIDMEQIKALYDLCSNLLANRDPGEAAALLPPVGGFFFGSTDIDEYYWSDLEATVDQLRPLVENPPTPTNPYSLVYHSSW